MSALLELHEVELRYGDTPVVQGLNMHVNTGELACLLGPSGCGKTTLLRVMAGLQDPSAGSLQLPPDASGSGPVAFVFQQPSLLPWRTTLQNVTLPLELIGRGNAAERKAAARAMLEEVDLASAIDLYPDQLSGGMKMRVSIARALVTDPNLLLLDEPFAALDDMLRNQLGQLLLRLWRERKFTAVMVTHNIGESILLSHRIGVMCSGALTSTIDNPLTFPRDETLRRSPEFGKFYGEVSDALRQQASLASNRGQR